MAKLEESVGENGSVITGYQFEQNTYSDSRFLEDTLATIGPAKEQVAVMMDGAYPMLGNQKLAGTECPYRIN